jgi:hypothetical protein
MGQHEYTSDHPKQATVTESGTIPLNLILFIQEHAFFAFYQALGIHVNQCTPLKYLHQSSEPMPKDFQQHPKREVCISGLSEAF